MALLAAVTALCWGALRIAETRGVALPPVTWTAPAGVALLALAVVATAVALRRRLRGARRPHPLGMARMAVLGKASAHVGPLVGGLYAGYLLVLLPALEIESRRDRAVLSATALLAAVVLSGAGLLLERACRVDSGRDLGEPPEATAA